MALEDIILPFLCPEESTLETKEVFKVKHSPAAKFKLEKLEEGKKNLRDFFLEPPCVQPCRISFC